MAKNMRWSFGLTEYGCTSYSGDLKCLKEFAQPVGSLIQLLIEKIKDLWKATFQRLFHLARSYLVIASLEFLFCCSFICIILQSFSLLAFRPEMKAS